MFLNKSYFIVYNSINLLWTKTIQCSHVSKTKLGRSKFPLRLTVACRVLNALRVCKLMHPSSVQESFLRKFFGGGRHNTNSNRILLLTFDFGGAALWKDILLAWQCILDCIRVYSLVKGLKHQYLSKSPLHYDQTRIQPLRLGTKSCLMGFFHLLPR